jgi:Rrf2 family protein
MIQIAQQGDNSKPVSLERVAQGTHVSKRYLEQVAIALKNAALLRSVSGRSGGYVLARPAEAITIGQIIQAAIGPINIVDCVRQPETCLLADTCECRLVYMLINKRITDVLNECSLADMADKKRLKSMAKELGQDYRAFALGQARTERALGGCPANEAEGSDANS